MKPGEIKYPHIFSPGRIGKMETKNRIKYASTETNFNTRDGFVTDAEVAYMEAQARGGAGIVTTQGAFTDPAPQVISPMPFKRPARSRWKSRQRLRRRASPLPSR